MKRFVSIVLIALLALSCIACAKYQTHYNAVLFVHSNTDDSAFMEFYQFEGTMVFTLRANASDTLKYTGTLETGSATVSYDCGDGKTALFSVDAGGEIADSLALLSGGTVYVIVETDGQCENGAFTFSIE